MPPKRNNLALPPRPPVMSWGRTALVLVIAILFDLLRAFFELFWFMGPALAGFLCTLGVNDALGTNIAGIGGKLVATGCAVGAGVLGTIGIEVTTVFGTVMAMAVGLLGWLVVLFILVIINARIFKTLATSWIWSAFGLAGSILPIVGAVPFITLSVIRLYYAQIKHDHAALKEWQKRTADIQMKIVRAEQAFRYQEQQVVEAAAEEAATHDEEYGIPEEARRAA